MSRSNRACGENRVPASTLMRGAGERVGERALPGRERLLEAVSSTKRLLQTVTATILLLAATPATALTGGQHPTRPNQPTRPLTRVLYPGDGYLIPHGSGPVRALQRDLARAGDPPGLIDGRYGPRTQQAMTRFQASHGLPADGIAGPETLTALAKPPWILYPGAGYAGHGSGSVRALQRDLAHAGDPPGPIDGRYGPRTERAVTRFQAARGLRVDGIAGPQTVADLRNRQHTLHHTSSRSHHRANRPTRSRPQTQRQPTAAPAARKIVPASHSNSSPPLGLLALLAAFAVALGLSATLLGRRRRENRGVGVSAATECAPPNDLVDAIGNPPNPITTPDLITTPNPTATHLDPHQPDDAAGAFRHALLLEEHGDQMGAVAAYQRADRLGHGAAACNLGVLLEQHGDPAGAEASYRRADQRGDANGAFNLAVLLEEQGDLTEAIAAYQRADRRGHGAAANNLGVLLEQHGDRAGAEASYRRADQRGDANGAFNLAVLLEERGDLIGALRAYERADQLGHPAIADTARAAAVELKRQIGSPTGPRSGGGHDGP